MFQLVKLSAGRSRGAARRKRAELVRVRRRLEGVNIKCERIKLLLAVTPSNPRVRRIRQLHFGASLGHNFIPNCSISDSPSMLTQTSTIRPPRIRYTLW